MTFFQNRNYLWPVANTTIAWIFLIGIGGPALQLTDSRAEGYGIAPPKPESILLVAENKPNLLGQAYTLEFRQDKSAVIQHPAQFPKLMPVTPSIGPEFAYPGFAFPPTSFGQAPQQSNISVPADQIGFHNPSANKVALVLVSGSTVLNTIVLEPAQTQTVDFPKDKPEVVAIIPRGIQIANDDFRLPVSRGRAYLFTFNKQKSQWEIVQQ